MQNQDYTDSPNTSSVPANNTVQVQPPIALKGDNFDLFTAIPPGVDSLEWIQAIEFYTDASIALAEFEKEISQ